MTHKEALTLALEALIGARAFLESDAPVEIWSLNDKAITAIKEALAQPNEKEADLLRALEIIAVGDANNPQAQAAEELIALGYWRDIPEARALAQPEHEPVAVLFEDGSIVKYEDLEFVPEKSGQRVQMLYTTPPQRKK